MYVMIFGLFFAANGSEANVFIEGPVFSTFRECVESGDNMRIRSDKLPLKNFVYKCVEIKKS